jgi:hypothetical protein
MMRWRQVCWFTRGQMWGKPRRPAPSIEQTAGPMVQCNARGIGCAKPEPHIYTCMLQW